MTVLNIAQTDGIRPRRRLAASLCSCKRAARRECYGNRCVVCELERQDERAKVQQAVERRVRR